MYVGNPFHTFLDLPYELEITRFVTKILAFCLGMQSL